MKSHRFSLMISVFAGLLLVVMLAGQNTGRAANDDGDRKWEHLAMPVEAAKGIGDAEVSRQIIQLGNQGWELVDVESLIQDGSTSKIVYFFKRPE